MDNKKGSENERTKMVNKRQLKTNICLDRAILGIDMDITDIRGRLACLDDQLQTFCIQNGVQARLRMVQARMEIISDELLRISGEVLRDPYLSCLANQPHLPMPKNSTVKIEESSRELVVKCA